MIDSCLVERLLQLRSQDCPGAMHRTRILVSATWQTEDALREEQEIALQDQQAADEAGDDDGDRLTVVAEDDDQLIAGELGESEDDADLEELISLIASAKL